MLRTRGEKIFDTVNVIVLFLIAIIMLFPFYVTLIHSIAPPEDFGRKLINLWPSRIDFTAIRSLVGSNTGLVNAYGVTLFTTVVGTFLNMLCTVPGSVALANKKLPYRLPLTGIFVLTMYFGGGMIPAYLLNKYLGLINSVWVMIIPGLVGVGSMFLIRNFIMGIPQDIIEAASIDGCSDIGLLWRIILPLSVACMATFALFFAVGHWNSFYACMMYITDPKKYNLQVYLREVLRDQRNMTQNPEMMRQLREADLPAPPSESLKAANIMAATLPIVCVYPFVQKYFVKGVVVGSLKG